MKKADIQYDVGGILRQHWEWIDAGSTFNTHQKRMLHALSVCRTAALGGHVDECTDCGHVRISYNSCRNRNCPKCQGVNREKWIRQREAELLPVPYFHVVFTLPDALNGLCLAHPQMMYKLLFDAAWQTVKTFGQDPRHLGALPGMTAVLHTWGQTMPLHPHLHCIVPGSGITPKGQWKTARTKGKFLFPVKAMSQVFRAKFVAALRKTAKAQNIDIEPIVFKQLFQKRWVVYAKRPFGGPKQVIEYLGRYTHKIAISNRRITSVTDTHVTFEYKDYRKNGEKRTMQLPVKEFIRRFAMHILPHKFHRIRHYGFLGSRHKKKYLAQARRSLGVGKLPCIEPLTWEESTREKLHYDPQICPECQQPAMRTVQTLIPKYRIRPPPLKPNLIFTK